MKKYSIFVKKTIVLQNNNNIKVPVNIKQVPDSLNNSAGVDTSTSNQIDFGSLQNKSLISVEVADTAEAATPIPRQLVIYKPKKKVHKPDSLNYYIEYLRYIDSVGYKIPEKINQKLFCYKENLYTKFPGLIKKNTERTYPVSKLKVKHSKNTIKKLVPKKHSEETYSGKKHITEKPATKTTVEHKHINTNYKAEDWLTGIIIFALIIFAWVRLAFYRKYKDVITSVFNYKTSYNLYKERNSIWQRAAGMLNFLFLLNVSIFIYTVSRYYNIQSVPAGFKGFSLIFITTSAIYILKTIGIFFIGQLFKAQEVAGEYISNLWLYNKVLGISMLIVNISFPFVKPEAKYLMLILALFFTVISLLLRYYRSLQIVIRIKLSFFYWILYLCTLEILPILIMVKLLK